MVSAMNLHQVEAALKDILEYEIDQDVLGSTHHANLIRCLAYVRRKNIAAHKRHMFFKLRADEQREALR